MPNKNENAERIGGPGTSHENRRRPETSTPREPHPTGKRDMKTASESGGGGVEDRHHSHDPRGKAGH